MKSSNFFLILLMCLTQSPHLAPAKSGADGALYCRRTSYSLRDFESGTTEVIAPNHSNRILLAKDFLFHVLQGQTELGSVGLKELSSNIEIGWAPDSMKFFIAYSDGGAEGTFHAHIYELAEGKVEEISEAVNVAFADFKARYYCKERGNNIFVEGWTSDSAKAFLIAEVFPTGDCGKDFGRLGGYLVDLRGQILHRYSHKETELIQKSCDKRDSVTLPANGNQQD